MQIFVDTIEEYIAQIPEERRDGFRKLLEIVDANLPMGFQQTMQYGMVTWCVPLETYPAGYCQKITVNEWIAIYEKNYKK